MNFIKISQTCSNFSLGCSTFCLRASFLVVPLRRGVLRLVELTTGRGASRTSVCEAVLARPLHLRWWMDKFTNHPRQSSHCCLSVDDSPVVFLLAVLARVRRRMSTSVFIDNMFQLHIVPISKTKVIKIVNSRKNALLGGFYHCYGSESQDKRLSIKKLLINITCVQWSITSKNGLDSWYWF